MLSAAAPVGATAPLDAVCGPYPPISTINHPSFVYTLASADTLGERPAFLSTGAVMSKQTVYLVVNAYDAESPTPVRLYDNRDAAERHAAHLNMHLGADEDEPVFEVWEESVRSEFQP